MEYRCRRCKHTFADRNRLREHLYRTVKDCALAPDSGENLTKEELRARFADDYPLSSGKQQPRAAQSPQQAGTSGDQSTAIPHEVEQSPHGQDTPILQQADHSAAGAHEADPAVDALLARLRPRLLELMSDVLEEVLRRGPEEPGDLLTAPAPPMRRTAMPPPPPVEAQEEDSMFGAWESIVLAQATRYIDRFWRAVYDEVQLTDEPLMASTVVLLRAMSAVVPTRDGWLPLSIPMGPNMLPAKLYRIMKESLGKLAVGCDDTSRLFSRIQNHMCGGGHDLQDSEPLLATLIQGASVQQVWSGFLQRFGVSVAEHVVACVGGYAQKHGIDAGVLTKYVAKRLGM